jgi:hypothetical protein
MFCGILSTFTLKMKIFHIKLSIPQNNVVDLKRERERERERERALNNGYNLICGP